MANFTIIDRTAGTNIGDMTAAGGLAGAFDGVTSQASSVCAGNAISATSAYIGKTLAASKRFGKAVIYGSNNVGFMSEGPASLTINIRGKAGSVPSSSTDGTIIGTATITDTPDESAGHTIMSTNGGAVWDHIFAQLTTASGAIFRVAELELYEFNPAGASVVIIG